MSGVLDLIGEPWTLEFMQRAFAVGIMTAMACGVIGTHVVLRGMAFVGDAVAHAVFPGIAVAFVLQANYAIGGLVAGVLCAVGIAVLAQQRRLKEDTVIGVFLVFAFGLGIVVLSTQTSYTGDLHAFLFGQILGIGDGDVWLVGVVGVLLVGVLALLHRELVAISLDRESSRAAGIPVFWLDVVLYVVVTTAIVISIQAVGNILVLGLLITPAATARLLTDRLVPMMATAAAIAALCAVGGLYLSYWVDLAAGGVIVLLLTAAFALAWLLAPRHGLIARRLRGARSS